ncbi:hypothetical protein BJX62DRAFT_241812 [Aspergillus germanicus]
MVFGRLGLVSLRVKSVETVNHNSKRLVFAFPDPRAHSGLQLTSALLTLSRPRGSWLPVIRPYTPINDLDEPGQLELLVKRYPAGKTSSHIHSLNPGDSLTFLAPLKGFAWKPNLAPHVYLLAGGAGITPMYQLIRGILKNPEDRTKITLVFGVNTEKDILLRPELEGLAERFPGRFEYLFTVSRPEGGEKAVAGLRSGGEEGLVRSGYIDEKLLRDVVGESVSGSRVFVCGPPAMEQALVGSSWGSGSGSGILRQLGFTKEQVHKF